MNVLFFSPGFPHEMPLFARGLAAAGARVIGLGDHPVPSLPERARHALSDYVRVGNLFDEAAVVATVEAYARRVRIDGVECLWEPGMMLAARLRERLGLPGMTVEQTLVFRDKEIMKQALDRAGIRTPRHHRAASEEAVREAVEAVGYPAIVKPIAGAGSADTYRIADRMDLERVLRWIRHVPEVSVEEFIEGEEYTFDALTAGGRILYENVAWYRPKPLIARTQEHLSPQTVSLRDHHRPHLQPGVALGRAVIEALGVDTAFTHMEWFLTPDGEAVFGEIGARPPGGRSVDLMNYASDIDTYTGWGETVIHGRFSQPVERKYNAAAIFKRARGQGRIRRIEGMHVVRELAPGVQHVDLLPIGAHRRNWKQTLVSDGYVILRHQDLGACCAMADRIADELTMWADPIW